MESISENTNSASGGIYGTSFAFSSTEGESRNSSTSGGIFRITSGNIPLSKRTPCEWSVNPAIQESVDKLIKEDPIKHKLAQNFGDFLMETPFANVDTFKIPQEDIRGENLRMKTIINNIKQYGLTIDDLSDEEKKLLIKTLGSSWMEVLNVE